MKRFATLLAVPLLAAITTASFAQSAESPPEWAYPVNPPGFKPVPDDGTIRRVPGSTAGYTLTQTRDLFVSPDWHPADYPARPEIVANGRKPDVIACGSCHRADGPGGPENANLTGLSAAYIIQQMADFKSGARKSSVMNRGPMVFKTKVSAAVSDADLEAAAAYFSTIKSRSIVKVVEAGTVPKTYITGWHLAVMKPEETEPLGQRIIEVPNELEQFVSRDSRASFTAYVPPGSIKKGQALAADGGGGKTVQCSACHGPGLKGLGPFPGIAGRSPSYIVRQLYDFKQGIRAGSRSAPMKPAVEKLTLEDMINLAAYAASLAP
ncbi:MAG: c-type cytochrome [Burkholderiales bacterium]